MKTIDAQWRRREQLHQLGAFGFVVGLLVAIGSGFLFAPDELPMLRPQQVAGRHFIPAWMLEGVELHRPRTRCSRTAPVRGAAGSECGPTGGASAYIPTFAFAPADGTMMGTACGLCSNICPYPENFGNWNAGGSVVTDNSASCPLAPDGTRTMALVVFSGGAGNGPFTTATVADGATVTHSVYFAKSIGGAACSLHLADGYTGGGDTVVSVPASPTRFTMTKTITGTATSPYINEATPGDCTDACVWGAQTDLGSSALVYIPMPKGSKGEPLTFGRLSKATCVKGNETTVVPGDLVECAYGQARVMPGGDGSGALGLSIWAQAHTNKLLRSHQFENAAWAKFSFGGVTDPTITANAALAPDGTMRADRLQVPALTTNAQYSIIEASGMVLDDPNSSGLYVAGNAQSGTLHFYTNGGTAADCISCPYVAYPNYTHCKIEGVHGGDVFVVGNDTLDCGGSSKAAVDVFIAQADDQAGYALGPPIETAGTAATMAAETAVFSGFPSVAHPTGSVAATTVGRMANSNEAYVMLFSPLTEPLLYTRWTQQDADFGMENYAAGASLSRDAVGPNRVVGWWNATNVAVSANGGADQLAAPGAYAGRTMTSLAIGSGVFGGVIKNVCVDSLDTFCR